MLSLLNLNNYVYLKKSNWAFKANRRDVLVFQVISGIQSCENNINKRV